jgi:CheY-like chemotaxis protein
MPTILVIEDDRFLKIATKLILSKAGYSVLGAGDGEEALSIVDESHPDLILLDLMLPKVSGLDVLRTLKGNPDTASIPVIVLTSLSQKNEERLRETGAAAFLHKGPWLTDPDALLRAVEQVLSQNQVELPVRESAQNNIPPLV